MKKYHILCSLKKCNSLYLLYDGNYLVTQGYHLQIVIRCNSSKGDGKSFWDTGKTSRDVFADHRERRKNSSKTVLTFLRDIYLRGIHGKSTVLYAVRSTTMTSVWRGNTFLRGENGQKHHVETCVGVW